MKDYVIMLTSSGGGLSAEFRRRVLASCKHNIKIIAVDNKDSESAKIFCDVFSKVPLGIDEKYNKKIEELVLKYNIDMVIPCSDEEALSLSKDRRSIEKHNCILACVDYDILKILSSKIDTYRFLKKNNIETPEFYEANSLNQLSDIVCYFLDNKMDVVIKPSSGRGGRNVIKISNDKTNGCISKSKFLKDRIHLYKDLFPVIVMEKFDSPIYDVDLLSWKGVLKRSVVRRRINANVPNDGHIIENILSLHNLAENISRIFNLSWLYDCDVMINSQGFPMILEINPRPSGSIAVTMAAGINFIDDMIDIAKNIKLATINLHENKIIVPYISLT